jgi:putative hemolysin
MPRRYLIALLALPSLVVACGGDEPAPASTSAATPESSTVTGLANPASEFCVEQGGTVEIVEKEGGQVGYCNLPDGSRIEEWEYFRANSPAGS